MPSPWTLLIAGIIFCAGGLWLFFRNAFEEDKTMLQPVLIILAGIALVGLAMARFYNV